MSKQFLTIQRITKILKTLTYHPDGLPLMKIIEKIGGAPKSSIFVILKELQKNKLITYLENEKKYKIGPELIKISAIIMHDHTIQKIARPGLEQLSKVTGEDVYLGILLSDKMHYLDKVEGSRSIRVNIKVGSASHLHATAIGKLLLSEMDQERFDGIFQSGKLPHYTPHTITDLEIMKKELKQIRAAGFSESKEEGMEGIYGIAAPIRNNKNEMVAGLCIAAPVKRAVENREKYIQLVVAVANDQ